MRTFVKNIIPLILVILFAGCESLLDPEIDNGLNTDQVWNDPDYAEGVLAKAYAEMPVFYNTFGSDFLDCATDNAVSNNYGASTSRMAAGGWSASSNPIDNWTVAYKQINNINMFLEKGLEVDYSLFDEERDSIKRARLNGEAYFLRAWYQWELLRRYAGPSTDGKMLGFPIVTEVLSDNNAPQLSRSTYEECVDQIGMDCDSALAYLPADYTGNDPELGINQKGRATSVAAKALKSRLFLYAASPLFNNQEDVQSKWERAAVASKEMIDIIGGLPNITVGFYNDPDSPELIMRRYTSSRSPENANLPPSYFGNGRTNPSQELVDAFPTANGYPIENALSGYDEENPYANRDPRFYNSVFYNGSVFKGDTIDVTPGGKDSEAVSVDRATRTGYYLRKWMSDKANLVPGNLASANHYFALFRKVEMYLNYAEAANEAWGPDQDPLGLGMTAQEALQAVRQRAGIAQPDNYLNEVAATGQEAFRELCHNERRIELCFENHRFFDLRRWNIDLNTLNQTVTGVKVEKKLDGSFVYSNFDVEKRAYKDYMYYGPLPYGEIIKTENLVQNQGW